jgi:hypothetical protein
VSVGDQDEGDVRRRYLGTVYMEECDSGVCPFQSSRLQVLQVKGLSLHQKFKFVAAFCNAILCLSKVDCPRGNPTIHPNQMSIATPPTNPLSNQILYPVTHHTANSQRPASVPPPVYLSRFTFPYLLFDYTIYIYQPPKTAIKPIKPG